MKNPFSIAFGRIPGNAIEREQITSEILKDFSEEAPVSSVYILTGLPGSGKTVSMHQIANALQEEKDWTVVKCTTDDDILHTTANAIGHQEDLGGILSEAQINLSGFGMGLEISGTRPIQDEVQALEQSLKLMKKKNWKLLICIDEVVSNRNVRRFVKNFQNWLGSGYPVRLLLTGLYQNISRLQDEKDLTFLYRAINS